MNAFIPLIACVAVFGLLAPLWSFRERFVNRLPYLVRGSTWAGPVDDALRLGLDMPFNKGWFRSVTRFVQTLTVRAPALLLCMAMAQEALILPGYVLNGPESILWKGLQGIAAILIVTESALPLAGGIIACAMGWLMWTHGLVAAVDLMPLASIVWVYASMPMKRPDHDLMIRWEQLKFFRPLFGLSLIAAGAYSGWDTWSGACEMLGGTLIASGVFVRMTSLVSLAAFTASFGASTGMIFLFPFAALALGFFSNLHSDQERQARYGRRKGEQRRWPDNALRIEPGRKRAA